MAQLPAPLRAALGLVATVADVVTSTVRDGRALSDVLPDKLPDRVLELPVLALSTAVQLSLRAQQHYVALTVRGDEVLAQLRGGAPQDPPDWAHFDDDGQPDETASASARDAAAPTEPVAASPAKAGPAQTKARPAKVRPAKASPAKAGAARKPGDPKPVAKETGVRPAKATKPAKAVRPAKAVTASTNGRQPARRGSISAPRNGKLSPFDRAPDADGSAGDSMVEPS